jgi:hypothetical protein
MTCKMGKENKQKQMKKIDNGQLLLTVTDKRQARPLVREGAQQRQHSEIQAELISGRKSQGGLDAKTYCDMTSDLRPQTSIRIFNNLQHSIYIYIYIERQR